MRASTIAVLLILLAVVTTHTEAGNILDEIKKIIKDAARWVKDNCSLDGKGLHCRGIRTKRSTEETGRQALLATLEKECSKFDLGDDAKMSDVVDVALEEMDDNKDGSLGIDESVRFTELMSLLDYCSDLKKKQKDQITTQEPEPQMP